MITFFTFLDSQVTRSLSGQLCNGLEVVNNTFLCQSSQKSIFTKKSLHRSASPL